MPENSETQTIRTAVDRFYEEWWFTGTEIQFSSEFFDQCKEAFKAGYEKAREIYTRFP